jgi:hypothetical protein
MAVRPEERLHFQISDYLKLQYPKIFFISEQSGLRVSVGLASKLKRTRSNHVHLDLYVLEPKGKYHGLILELKAKDIYQKKNPTLLLKNEHLTDQKETIEKLNKKGYKAAFAVQFEEARKLIDDYLNGSD